MTLVRLLGTILPVAVATMSMVPHHAHARATQKKPMSAKTMARPTGDGGVSTISSAAGRNASSSRRRSGTTSPAAFMATAGLADFKDPTLQAVQGGVAAAGLDQGIVRAVLD